MGAADHARDARGRTHRLTAEQNAQLETNSGCASLSSCTHSTGRPSALAPHPAVRAALPPWLEGGRSVPKPGASPDTARSLARCCTSYVWYHREICFASLGGYVYLRVEEGKELRDGWSAGFPWSEGFPWKVVSTVQRSTHALCCAG